MQAGRAREALDPPLGLTKEITMTAPGTREPSDLLYPRRRMVAIFDDEAAARDAERELRGIGIDRSEIDVLAGPDGATVLDATGERHGVRGKLLRLAQWTAEEGNALEAHQRALLQGKAVVYVTARGSREKHAVASALHRADGYGLAWFGRWIVEREQ
jgi:hypothetical protein